jgi:hypothetical protein
MHDGKDYAYFSSHLDMITKYVSVRVHRVNQINRFYLKKTECLCRERKGENNWSRDTMKDCIFIVLYKKKRIYKIK